MTATQQRFMLSLLALAVLAGGCSALRGSEPQARAGNNGSPIEAELIALRQENAGLKQQQTLLQKNVEQMNRQMNQRMEEQRRFQDMMATNFDMLEQSISMALSRRQAEQNRSRTAPAAAVPQVRRPPAAKQAPKMIAPPAPSAPAANYRVNASRTPHAPKAATSAPAGRQASNPITRRGEPRQNAAVAVAVAPIIEERQARTPVSDADLTPPANPRQLTPHRAAKPLYDKAFAAFAMRDYSTAVQHFADFLNRYPEDIYSDNAQFWIAEAHYRQSEWSEAEEAYRRVLRNYEHRSTLEGFKTPDAIYRIGQTYLKRDNPQKAAYYFANVVERWESSSAGQKAQREMSAILASTAQAQAGTSTSPSRN